MKQLAKIAFLFLTINLYGQTYDQTVEWNNYILENLFENDYKDSLTKYNFSSIWTNTDNTSVYGFIGENYQRIRIKIISAIKDTNDSNTYRIYGKSMVKDNICEFKGIIKIKSIKIYRSMHWGVDDEYKYKGIKKEGILTAQYHFAEDSAQKHSGIFDGILTSSWYIDKNGLIKYDDIEKNSDSYFNNQFVGIWTDYINNHKKTCNWGDYRIPFCGDLDEGAGGFSPYDTYLKYGWQTVRDAYWSLQPDSSAKQEEQRQWWKK